MGACHGCGGVDLLAARPHLRGGGLLSPEGGFPRRLVVGVGGFPWRQFGCPTPLEPEPGSAGGGRWDLAVPVLAGAFSSPPYMYWGPLHV